MMVQSLPSPTWVEGTVLSLCVGRAAFRKWSWGGGGGGAKRDSLEFRGGGARVTMYLWHMVS